MENIRFCEAIYTEEEVKTALFQMNPLKAPGPDGLPALFFQKYWHIVGHEVCKLVLDILNNQKHPGIINNTHIVLIPKCKNPVKPQDFRPISLCNVVMKLVTKVIANGLKEILPEIIDEEQSAFVKDRPIMDNALIAMECFHWLKKKVKGKKGVMALKLDMSKAYDRLEGSFIVEVLATMGFPPAMVSLIKRCINSVSYKVLVNGVPSKSFTPERGLRQGDPLSPYLFIMCANVFSGLLKKAAMEKEIHGVKIARNSPTITHLFFADDSLLFARANLEEAKRIKDILRIYEEALGQVVSFEKSEVSFSRNVDENVRDSICNWLGVNSVSSHSRYLGLPIMFGRSKKVIFAMVVERVWKKIKGWKEKFLSSAGKEVLIKAVAQAIPTYVMSCYKLPDSVCLEIEGMIARFWWGSKQGERKMHWLGWDKLAKAKAEGGLGFRGICDFNSSLLGKHYWRLLNQENSLVGKVLKGRYFPKCSIDSCGIGYNPSYAWRSIIGAREVVQRGACWRIGNGEKVNILKDRWIPKNTGFKVQPGGINVEDSARVCDIIDRDNRCWKIEDIQSMFNSEDAMKITSIPLSVHPDEDNMVWQFEKNGEFSVKTAYHASRAHKDSLLPGPSSPANQKIWPLIWKAPISARQRNFLWRVAKNILPSRGNLLKKGMFIDSQCPLCSAGTETVQHLLMECVFAKQVLFASVLSYRIPSSVSVIDWLQSVLECGDADNIQIICACLYKLWAARNLTVFHGKSCCPIAVAADAFESVQEFNRTCPGSNKRRSIPIQHHNSSWPTDVHLVQVDAGFNREGKAVFGCVFKNHNRDVILAASKVENVEVESSLAEMLALRWCIKIALNLNLKKAVFKSDALSVVDCINGIDCNVFLEPIAADCRVFLSRFSFSSVLFTPREDNYDAHNMVLLGKLYGSRTWLDSVPAANSVVSGFSGPQFE
ncbi:uncharacterized protein LOC131604425 [Vicia villosa]|uniref:uncharacterized protein LOC131604425 n=1 Tax=Vicia villosa TaxID=3911 RepID=UPI00273BBB6B|nr:uncharacterized protein LOC131604425 [Vicia villosa]